MADDILADISIIIPVFNEARGIDASLRALQKLRTQAVEVIVVDGGSTDDTKQIAFPLCDKLLASSTGRARQMNAGARASKGNLLIFLHSDTWLPDTVSLVDVGQRVVAGTGWGFCAIKLSGRSWVFRIIEWMMNWRSRLSGIGTGDQTFVVCRETFLRMGGFPEIPLMEDIALSKLLNKRLGRPVSTGVTVTTSSRRWEQRGVARTILLMWRLRLLYYVGVAPDVLHEKYYR